MHKLSVHEDIKNQCDQCDFNLTKNKTTSRSISNVINVITNLNIKVTPICINCLYMKILKKNNVINMTSNQLKIRQPQEATC